MRQSFIDYNFMFLAMKEMNKQNSLDPENMKYSDYWQGLGEDGLTQLDIAKLLSKICEKYGHCIDSMFTIKSMIDAKF